ncbi:MULTISPECIES: hypothetical protein [unclassified Streptomyces]|nr:hypothetical protein [Streptomyces sp. SM10]
MRAGTHRGGGPSRLRRREACDGTTWLEPVTDEQYATALSTAAR